MTVCLLVDKFSKFCVSLDGEEVAGAQATNKIIERIRLSYNSVTIVKIASMFSINGRRSMRLLCDTLNLSTLHEIQFQTFLKKKW